MAFCTRCGNPIEEGAVCSCSESTKPQLDAEKAKGFFESLKNRMGIGDPERNATDTYERDLPIVPDCIKPNENEIPVKQYNIAVLRNLLKFERSEGRLQVTNKRVIFRAVGRSIGGRTTLQQEFAIDELSGIEAKRNYRFGFINLLFGVIIVSLLFSISAGIFVSIDGLFAQRRYESILAQIQKAEERYRSDRAKVQERYGEDQTKMQEELNKLDEKYQNDKQKRERSRRNPTSGIFGIVKFLIGLAGVFAFFWWKRKWLLKLAILGISLAAFMSPSRGSAAIYDILDGYGSPTALLGGFNLFVLLTLIVVIAGLALYSLKPNFVLLIKTKGGLEGAAPIKIQRSRGFWLWRQDGGTGFSEVFPTNESEGAIREINVMINDIQKLGDLGLQKWVSK